LVALLCWADVSAARTMAVPTLTVGMLDQWFGREETSVGALLGLVVALLSLALGLQLWSLVRTTTWQDSARLGALPAPRLRLRGWWALAPWLLSLPQLVLAVLVPAVVIGSWTMARLERVNMAFLGSDTLRTLLVAAGGTLFAALLAFPLIHSQALGQHSKRMATLGKITFVVFALPPSVLALAWLSLLPGAAESGPVARIHSSALPLVGSFGVRFAAVFIAVSQAALLRQAGPHAALLRVLGRTDWLSFLRLLWPFLVRPLSAAAAFVFLECLKDELLPLLLQPFGFNTISTRVFQYAQTQRLRDCAVWVLCLGLLGLYPLFTLARQADAGSEDTVG
jgi:iron(III) transport system permease protein